MRERRLPAPTPRPPGRWRPEPAGEGTQPLIEVDTPDTPTIESLAALLDVDPSQTLKCVMFDVAGTTTAVLVPGDREVNVDKLGKIVFPAKVRPFDEDDFARARVREGLRGTAGLRRRRAGVRGSHGARRE